MKHNNLFALGFKLALLGIKVAVLGIALFLLSQRPAQAQDAPDTSPGIQTSVDLRDAPVRSALEQLFREAKLDFVIAPDVQGTVTMTLKDLPLEQVLKIICRSNSIPLTFTKEGKRYEVKVRKASVNTQTPEVRVPEPPATTAANYEVINLQHLDPRQLTGILGNIIMLPTAYEARYGGAQGSTNTNGAPNGNANNANRQGNPGGNGSNLGSNLGGNFGFQNGNGGYGLGIRNGGGGIGSGPGLGNGGNGRRRGG
jgi:hypothetical protein